MHRFAVLGFGVALLLGACASEGGSGSGPSVESTGDATVAPLRLAKIADADEPVALVAHPGDGVLYVGERAGRVRPVRDGSLAEPALDISGRTKAEGERGLLGLAFSPDGTWMYVHYTNRDGDTRVDAYPFGDGRADPTRRRELLTQRQPYPNHNGGALITGPDGRLYLGLGDGGSQGDPDGNGQNRDTLLGKILRIEPTPAAAQPYRVPADNPFVGDANARPEVWVYGLRNPWRFSFDRATGDVWIGDVGSADREEIDWRRRDDASGTNFGWRVFEGTKPFGSGSAPDAVPPVYEYSHADGGCSVVGGYVYRGTRMPTLQGKYLFGDFCTGRIQALVRTDDRAVPVAGVALAVKGLVSFGEDADGELYALSLDGPVYRIEPA